MIFAKFSQFKGTDNVTFFGADKRLKMGHLKPKWVLKFHSHHNNAPTTPQSKQAYLHAPHTVFGFREHTFAGVSVRPVPTSSSSRHIACRFRQQSSNLLRSSAIAVGLRTVLSRICRLKWKLSNLHTNNSEFHCRKPCPKKKRTCPHTQINEQCLTPPPFKVQSSRYELHQ